jgi:hypothetical protein
VDDGFNLWLSGLKDPVINNIVSLNSASWGVRIQTCVGGTGIGNIRTEHGPDVNADGVHFIDCRDMSCNGFEILTKGDDGFIVEALQYDVSNLHLTGITVQCPLEVTAAGRGVLVFRETLGGTLSATRLMENIKIEAVTRNCGGPSNAGAGLAVNTPYATLRNSVFDIQSDSCTRGMAVFAGDSTYPGTIENCVFRLVESNSTATPTQFGFGAGSTIDGNRAELTIFNPPDGQIGAVLAGNKWSGYINVDYDPSGTKASPQTAVNLLITQSTLNIDAKGGNRNILVRNGSSFNTFYLGALRDAVLRDIEIEGTAVDTVFVGGSVSGAVVGATSATRFIGTAGVNNSIFVGDYGIGATSLEIITDWDDTTRLTGIYGTDSTSTGGIVPGGYSGFGLAGTLHFDSLNNGSKNQLWISVGSQAVWHRRYTASTWGTWRQVQSTVSGTTAARPTTGLVTGLMYLDTTLGKPIWRNGSNWVDATGATV